MSRFLDRSLVALIGGMAFVLLTTAAPSQARQEFYKPSETELTSIRSKMNDLAEAMERVAEVLPVEEMEVGDAYADVAVFHKAAEWIVRHGEFFEKDDVSKTLTALDRGLKRASALESGDRPWTSSEGGTVRGYVSKVDGSVQPYAVYLPSGYDGTERIRLDVVLHGRNARLNEVRFIHDHQGKPAPDGSARVVLHVYGRGNNAYRWAGESDVFEAIEAVKRHYKIDPKRIVLRGFSMGGAGAWHLGLHHPSLWAAVEAGAGFTETINYARLDNLPDYQRKALHIYDATDYALNAFNVPIVGYGGERDPQLQASENIVEALRDRGFELKTDGLQTRAESIDFLRVVGAEMGHRVDPASADVINTFLNEHAREGLAPDRPQVRFETYTVKYNRAAWIKVEEMIEHYRRATVEAGVDPEDRNVVEIKTDNVAVLAVERQVADRARIDGDTLPLADAVGALLPHVYYQRTESGWIVMDYDQSRAVQLNTRIRKHRGLQGPIDDAFTAGFLCVRGTGTPWNPRLQDWADARLERFSNEWSKWMRGDLPVKDDRDVTAEDIRDHHLVLFGDPGSNRLIAQLIGTGLLPLSWDQDRIKLHRSYSADDHAPVLIAPNPLNVRRYVVLNSGHTFGEDAFRGTNALLFPRLGDFGVFRLGENRDGDDVVTSGYFDERWQVASDMADD